MSEVSNAKVFDVVGIGIGPFNLSTAALLRPVPGLTAAFFERRPTMRWHPGLLFDTAKMQTPFLTDLVTLAAPTSPYSFVAYLHASGRLLHFLGSGSVMGSRLEFEDYLRWAAAQLDNLYFGRQVVDVEFDGENFVVRMPEGEARGRNLLLGAGRTAYVPECARGLLGEPAVLHAERYLEHSPTVDSQHVIVVGSGQTGAEIVLDLLNRGSERPAQLTWITRRSNLLVLDDTPFSNEYFTPGYAKYFYQLPERIRDRELASQKLASDGISASTLHEIYEAVYRQRFLGDRAIGFRLLPRRTLVGLEGQGRHWQLALEGTEVGGREQVVGNVVVLATGYEDGPPECIGSLAARIPLHRGRFHTNVTVRPTAPRSPWMLARRCGRRGYAARPRLAK